MYGADSNDNNYTYLIAKKASNNAKKALNMANSYQVGIVVCDDTLGLTTQLKTLQNITGSSSIVTYQAIDTIITYFKDEISNLKTKLDLQDQRITQLES